MRKPVLIALCTLLTSCALSPDYVRPEAPTPGTWRTEVDAAASLADLRWWQQLGDPVLDDLVQTALRNNLDLQEANARIAQYLGLRQASEAGLMPRLEGVLSGGKTRVDGKLNPSYQAQLNISWELDLWGRIRQGVESGQAQLAASEAARRSTLLSLVASVASEYLALRGLDRQLEIARDTEADYAKGLRVFQLRHRYGTISRVELAQQESLYQGVKRELPRLESEIRQKENALSVLLGQAPAMIARGQALDDLRPPAIPAVLPAELLERRPDIVEAEQNLKAAHADVAAARAEWLPRLTLGGMLGMASGDIGQLLAAGSESWSASSKLSGAIFDGGATAAKVDQQEASRQQALLRYRKKILTSLQEVEDALIKTRKGQEQLQALDRQVRSNQEYARLSKLKFDAGSVDYLQVRDANQALFDSRLAQARTRSTLLGDLVAVYKAMGGGWVVEADRLTQH